MSLLLLSWKKKHFSFWIIALSFIPGYLHQELHNKNPFLMLFCLQNYYVTISTNTGDKATWDPLRLSSPPTHTHKKNILLQFEWKCLYLEGMLKKCERTGKWGRKEKRQLNAISSRKLLLWETRTWSFWETWEASTEHIVQGWGTFCW